MRLRPLLWALILVGGFYYVTSVAHWNVGQFVRKTTASWSSPSTATTAGFHRRSQQYRYLQGGASRHRQHHERRLA